jgi:alpha-D-xyloside xylohydrolase
VWTFGEDVYEVLAHHLRLRETLRPYVRKLMRQAHEDGSPVMRAMFYTFPDDAACWDLNDQYMFGDDILVAPVVELGARERDVYLPAGCSWTNAHDGSVHPGGQTVRAAAPLEVIPLFTRDGSHREIIQAPADN